jgi:hypothetical protein
MKTSTKLIIVLVLIIVIGIAGWWFYFTNFTGQEASRYLGKSYRQVIEVKNAVQILSIDFQSDTLGVRSKLITYKALDGYVYSEEYKNLSPLEGTIRWVPKGESEYSPSWYRGRTFSRLFGVTVNLELPDDCDKVMSVASVKDYEKGGYIKNLVYRSKDGHIFSKEYRDGLIDRNLEGWLEVKIPEQNTK